jgi:hypothetical protein
MRQEFTPEHPGKRFASCGLSDSYNKERLSCKTHQGQKKLANAIEEVGSFLTSAFQPRDSTQSSSMFVLLMLMS